MQHSTTKYSIESITTPERYKSIGLRACYDICYILLTAKYM